MGQRERDRLKVLHEVESGHLKQGEAAAQLRMSERGFRKLLKRYRKKGDAAVVHGLRGRVSKRRISAKVASAAVRLVKKEYSDFGPTLASEYLEEEHGIALSRETVRKLLTAAGVWKPKQRRLKQVHVWRARRNCRGELVQWDTSVHAWLEERGPEKMYLVALIDDATNWLFARFVEADSTEQHMQVLWAYLEQYGRPQSVYTDRASIFQPTLAPGWQEQEPGPRTETQMGRALRELGIEWIAARSPQAKGRVERCFGTLQDRLVKALRRAGVKTLEGANAYLEREFLPMWNHRFVRSPGCSVNAHRPLEGLDLASVLSQAEQRKVDNAYTIKWDSERWQIPKQWIRRGLRGSSIRVEHRLDGTRMAWVGRDAVRLERCAEQPTEAPAQGKRPAKRFIPPPGQSHWMDGFRVQGNPPWKAWREEQAPAVSAPLRSPSGLPAPG